MTALAFAAMLLAPGALTPLPLGRAEGFWVIVNAANATERMAADDMSEIFLGKTERWESGFRASPVDQAGDSECREAFSRAVHRKDVNSIKRYWRKLVFAGLGEAPRELASDAAVLDFVANNVGAVGYVCRDPSSEGRVRELKVVNDG